MLLTSARRNRSVHTLPSFCYVTLKKHFWHLVLDGHNQNLGQIKWQREISWNWDITRWVIIASLILTLPKIRLQQMAEKSRWIQLYFFFHLKRFLWAREFGTRGVWLHGTLRSEVTSAMCSDSSNSSQNSRRYDKCVAFLLVTKLRSCSRLKINEWSAISKGCE